MQRGGGAGAVAAIRGGRVWVAMLQGRRHSDWREGSLRERVYGSAGRARSDDGGRGLTSCHNGWLAVDDGSVHARDIGTRRLDRKVSCGHEGKVGESCWRGVRRARDQKGCSVSTLQGVWMVGLMAVIACTKSGLVAGQKKAGRGACLGRGGVWSVNCRGTTDNGEKLEEKAHGTERDDCSM